VVDDGLATGATMRAAVRAVRTHAPSRIVVCVPVAASETAGRVREEADEVVCVVEAEGFHAVSAWYEDFAPTSDDEVRAALGGAH
jgi:predicted phosphoribosyltransferase